MRKVWILVFAIAGCSGLGRGGSAGPGGQPDMAMRSSTGNPDLAGSSSSGGSTFNDMCGSSPTTLVGSVLAPNGHDPIANAFAYVPTSVGSFPTTVACELCNQPIDGASATTTSLADGSFVLDIGALPVTATVQLTVNIGRFRHTSTVTVTPCMPTGLTTAETSLPGKPLAGTDDIPKIAVATGNQDQLDTVLAAMGMDDTLGFDCYEGRPNPGAGKTLKALTSPCGMRTGLTYIEDLLSNETMLETYNLVFLSCAPGKYKSLTAAQQASIVANLKTWTQKGGRLFVTDNSYDYLAQAYPAEVGFLNGDGTVDAANQGVGGTTTAPASYNGQINDPALATWLQTIGAVPMGVSTLTLQGYLNKWSVVQSVPTGTIDVVDATNAVAYGTGTAPSPSPGPATSYPQSLKFDINGSTGDACGRAIYTSYHTLMSTMTGPDPTAQLSPQERILEYLMFEASSCIGPVS